MSLVFDDVPTSTSALVETIWRSRSDEVVPFTSQAINHWEIVIWKFEGKSFVTLRGSETKATPAASHKNAEYLGIQFRLGTYMPHLPTVKRVDGEILLPQASSKSVWLNGSAWQIPEVQDVDVFVKRLELTGGHIVIIPAGVPHKFVNSGAGVLRQIDIHLNTHFVTDWLEPA